MDQEQIRFEFEPESVSAGLKQVNSGFDSLERRAVEAANKASTATAEIGKSAERAGSAMERAADMHATTIVRIVDRSKLSTDRYLDSLERRVQALKSPLDRLASEQANALNRFGGDPKAVDAINQRFSALIANQKQIDLGDRLDKAADASKRAAREADTFQAALGRVNQEQRRSAAAQKEMLDGLERRASFAGKSGVEKLALERDLLTKSLGGNKTAIAAVEAQFAKLIAVEQAEQAVQSHGIFSRSTASGRLLLGLKDFFEGRTTYGQVELATAAQMFFQKRSTTAVSQAAGFASAGITGAEGVAAGAGAAGLAEGAAGLGVVATAAGIATIAVGGTVAALGLAAVVGHKAAESLAAWGIEQKDLQERTGLTATELGQFQFAARSVGQEAGITEKLMRGLVSVTEDMSPAGQKARDTLADMNVRVTDLHGNTKPTGELLLELSDAFNKLPAGTKRSSDAMDIFKRIGVETIPFLKNLRENVDYFTANGLPSPSQDEIDKNEAYKKQLEAIDVRWESLKRSFKESIVAKVDFVFSVGGGVSNKLLSMIFGDEAVNGAIDTATGKRFPSLDAQIAEDNKRLAIRNQQDEIRAAGGEPALKAAGQSLQASLDAGLEGQQGKLARLKQDYEELRNGAIKDLGKDLRMFPAEADKHKIAIDAARSAYQQQSEIVKELEKDESKRIANLEKMRDLIREGQGYLRIGSGPTETIVSEQELAAANQPPRKTPSLFRHNEPNPFHAVQKAQFEEKQLADLKEGLQVGLDGLVFISPQSSRAGGVRRLPSGESIVPGQEMADLAGSREQQAQLDRDRLTALGQQREATIHLLELRTDVGGEADTARMVAALREDGLKRELRFTGDISQYRRESLQNEIQLREKIAQIEKQQLDSIKSETQGLLHTLFTDPSSFGRRLGITLRDAALKPIEEGLANIIAKNVKPVVFGEAGKGGIAGTLHDIFGKEPQPRLELKTNLDKPNHLGDVSLVSGAVPVIVKNLPATQDWQQAARSDSSGTRGLPFGLSGATAALATILNLGGGLAHAAPLAAVARPGIVQSTIDFGEGVTSTGPGRIFGSGGLFGAPGGTAPFAPEVNSVPAGVVQSTIDFGDGISSTGPGQIFGGGSLFGAPGGTAPFAPGAISLPGTGAAPGAAGGGFGGILGSLKNLAGFKGILSNLGNIGMDKGGLPGVDGKPGTDLGGGLFGGHGVGGMAGGAMLLGGTALAMHGLTGASAGTWSGIAQGTAGGALIGAKFGGPLGAAIGAGVGFGIGLGEKLAGVESKENEAKRLVKDIYKVSIDGSTAKSIVDLAKSKYAGHVSIAVRDPEVQKMLQLYAAGTNQPMPLSSTTPRSGSLVESNGQLYQQAGYQYGHAYSFQSPYPILGGVPTGQWPSQAATPAPSQGPIVVKSLSLSVGDKGASDFFTGQVVTPDLVQSRWASAAKSSNGRQQNSALIQQPGLIVS